MRRGREFITLLGVALVGFAGCDKKLPGIMMAMVRSTPERVHLRRRHAARQLARRGVRGYRLRRRGAGDDGRHGRQSSNAEAGVRANGRRLPRTIHRQHHGDGCGGSGLRHLGRR